MMTQYIFEFIGTLVLVLLGDGVCANVTLNKSKAQGAGWVVIALAWGFAVMCGVLQIPGYEECRPDYLDCEWLPPRWDWVDPLKDINAEAAAITRALSRPSFEALQSYLARMGIPDGPTEGAQDAIKGRSAAP